MNEQRLNELHDKLCSIQERQEAMQFELHKVSLTLYKTAMAINEIREHLGKDPIVWTHDIA